MKNMFRNTVAHDKLRGQQTTKNIPDLLIFTTLVVVIGTLLGGSLTWIFAIMHPIGRPNTQQETTPFGIYIGNMTSVTSEDLLIDKTISVTREDLQTGRVIWTHNLFKGPHPSIQRSPEISSPYGPSPDVLRLAVDLVSTVIPAGNTVYALLNDRSHDQHIVAALDTTNGTVRWQYSYPGEAQDMLLYNGTLYVSTSNTTLQPHLCKHISLTKKSSACC